MEPKDRAREGKTPRKIDVLLAALTAADYAWTDAIEAAFPNEWPGDVRYQARGSGETGTPLRAAYDARMAAREAFEAAGGYGAWRAP